MYTSRKLSFDVKTKIWTTSPGQDTYVHNQKNPRSGVIGHRNKAAWSVHPKKGLTWYPPPPILQTLRVSPRALVSWKWNDEPVTRKDGSLNASASY